MHSKEAKEFEMQGAVARVISPYSKVTEDDIVNLIRVSIQTHKQGSGLHFSDTEKLVKEAFFNRNFP